jgi:hypothetical protein
MALGILAIWIATAGALAAGIIYTLACLAASRDETVPDGASGHGRHQSNGKLNGAGKRHEPKLTGRKGGATALPVAPSPRRFR